MKKIIRGLFIIITSCIYIISAKAATTTINDTSELKSINITKNVNNVTSSVPPPKSNTKIFCISFFFSFFLKSPRFKLWDKLYKFYDFNIWLNQYQEEYKEFCKSDRWNPDDDDDFWPNHTYSEIQKNEREWFQYPDITKINELLEELWKNAKLSNKSEELWMFMYLTWMSWEYILLDYDLNLKNDNRSIRDGDGSTNKDAKSFFISIK